MVPLINITMLLALLISQPISIDNAFETKVMAGRDAVTKFRILHTEMYKKGIRTSREEFRLLGIMTWELSEAGYTKGNKITKFFRSSENLNAKQLGYEDKNELDKDASISDMSDYLNMWK